MVFKEITISYSLKLPHPNPKLQYSSINPHASVTVELEDGDTLDETAKKLQDKVKGLVNEQAKQIYLEAKGK